MARVFVLLGVMLSVFGGATALAAEAYARVSSAPTCHCPHDDADRAACPCCNTDSSKGGCLPISGAAAAPALAPAIADALLIPVPPLSGIVAVPGVRELHGRLSALRLERPPRA